MGLTLSACSLRPIEDGQQVGPLIQMRDFSTSCFLLEHEPGLFSLFDACNQASGGSILRTLDNRGYGSDAVRAVFLTHGHPDHVGGLSVFGRARVYALNDEQDLVADEGGKVDRRLADGTEVEVGNYTVRTFAVPGHTPGSAIYEVGKVLVMGDTVVVRRDGSLEARPDRKSDDPDQNVRSVRDLARRLDDADVEVDWLAPAHSGPVQGIEPLLEF